MADADVKSAPGWGNSAADAATQDLEQPSDTVSRTELKKVIAERDGYKKRLRQIQKQTDEGEEPEGSLPGPAYSTAPGSEAQQQDASRDREKILRRKLMEKDRTIGQLLIDNEIAETAASLGAYDPKAVIKLARDLFTVKAGKVQLSEELEDTGLSRFDDNGQEKKLPDVVSDFLSRHNYLLRPTGMQGAGSRSQGAAIPMNMHGMNADRYAKLSNMEKNAVREMAGVPTRKRVW